MLSVLGDVEAMTALGERIRAERLRRNFTQGHMAAVVGISEPTYRKIEAGDGSVEFRHVAKTLAVLGYQEALSQIIQETPLQRLPDLLAPERQRASVRRKPRSC